MDIGMQTGGLSDAVGMETALKMIAEAGFQTIDFGIDGFHALNAQGRDVFYLSEEEALDHFRPLKEVIRANGLRVQQMHGPIPTYTTDPVIQENIVTAIKNSIAVAGLFECPYLIIHPAHLGFDVDLNRQETLDVNKKLFDQLFEDLERHNVEACLENMFRAWHGKIMGSACAHPHEALEYVNTLNEMAGTKRVSFCLDTGHALLTGSDIYQSIIDLAPILTTLHIHDNNGIEDQHRMPWTGILDWPRFTRGLREINYQGVLSFETFAEFKVHPKEVFPQVLRLKAAIGRHFAEEIRG